MTTISTNLSKKASVDIYRGSIPRLAFVKGDNMIYIGVDPGTQGGVAIIKENNPPFIFPLRTYKTFLKTKTKKGNRKARNELDVDALVSDIHKHTGVSPIMWSLMFTVCIEKLTQAGGQFADSTGQLMKNYGRLLAVFEIYGVKITHVSPQAWQKWCMANMSIKARARATLSDHKKSLSIEYCREKHPQLSLIVGRKRTPHDGCADAVVLCDYLKESEV